VKGLRGMVFPIVMVLIGIALIVRMAAIGTIIGVVLGVLFIAAGAGRIYLERRT
jgi:hypothetical protein